MNLATVFLQDGEVIIPIPEPGERCIACDRRVPKPRKSSSPDTRRLVTMLPVERAASVEEGLENLQAYVGADTSSYPRGALIESLLLLGGQHREELRAWFTKEEE